MSLNVMSFIEKQQAVSNDPYGKINEDVQLKSDPNSFAKLWRSEDMKKQLDSSIRAKREEQNLPKKTVSERMLIEEYWRQWLQIDEKDQQTQLLRHPGLTLKDYNGIQHIITNERARQFYWAVGMSLGTYGVYHLSLKKKAMFYNFFQKKSPYRIINYSKNFFGGLALVWTWTLALSQFFDQKIPTDIAKKGFFRDYKIIFEQVYV